MLSAGHGFCSKWSFAGLCWGWVNNFAPCMTGAGVVLPALPIARGCSQRIINHEHKLTGAQGSLKSGNLVLK